MNIVITGASNGIGYQTVKSLCAKVKGIIYVISRNQKKLTELKAECKEISKDVLIKPIVFDLEKILLNDNKLKEEIDSNHIDILINNAGALINKSFDTFEISEINTVFNINVISPALLIKELLYKMGGSSKSHVVSISSMGGFQGSSKYPGLSFYSASKGALAILTEALAAEYNDRNIKFNCLALGAVQTEMLQVAFPGYQAPVSADVMGEYVAEFAIRGDSLFNGKIIPVALSNP